METNNKNKFIVVSYALYDVTNGDNGEEMLIERTTARFFPCFASDGINSQI